MHHICEILITSSKTKYIISHLSLSSCFLDLLVASRFRRAVDDPPQLTSILRYRSPSLDFQRRPPDVPLDAISQSAPPLSPPCGLPFSTDLYPRPSFSGPRHLQLFPSNVSLAACCHLKRGLHLPIHPFSWWAYAILGRRSSFILSTCPDTCKYPLPIRYFGISPPSSDHQSSFDQLSHLLQFVVIQLFSHTCSLCRYFSDTVLKSCIGQTSMLMSRMRQDISV